MQLCSALKQFPAWAGLAWLREGRPLNRAKVKNQE